MITIAVDAMGGDNAPRPEVEGSVLAARELGVRVCSLGSPMWSARSWPNTPLPTLPIDIIPASEVITMEDHPAQAFRRKKDSSADRCHRALVQQASSTMGLPPVVTSLASQIDGQQDFCSSTLESVMDKAVLVVPS